MGEVLSCSQTRDCPHTTTSSHQTVASSTRALSTFFNSPHPLEILKDGSAYGPKGKGSGSGSVYRDHDMNLYLRSVRAVVRKEVRHLREAERERWRLLWWPLAMQGVLAGAIGQQRRGLFVDAVVRGGREMVRWVRSHAHLLVVLLLPAKLLVLGALLVVRLR